MYLKYKKPKYSLHHEHSWNFFESTPACLHHVQEKKTILSHAKFYW